MAQKVKIILEDDLDGGPADETVRFGLDGGSFEIDLSSANAPVFATQSAPSLLKLAVYRATARPAVPSVHVLPQVLLSATLKSLKFVSGAQENGYKVSSRGRIHQEIQDAYYAAKKDK